MSDAKDMSIEEILASCRQTDGSGGGQAAAAASGDTAQPSTGEEAAAAEASGASSPESASAGPKSAKEARGMSVEEMLAAARGEKSGAKKPAAAPAAKAKPAAKPAAKASPKEAAAPKRTGPMDTASVLAAARKSAKPGPMTKAEAAAKAQPSAAAKAPAKKKLEVPPMPSKPAYARPAPAPAAAEGGRRTFLGAVAGAFVGSSLAIGFSTLTLTNVLWALGLARFMFPNILTEPPMKFKVGFPADFAAGQVETKFKARFGVWIVRYEYEGEPQIYALQSVCTHLGCTPNWLEGEQKFKCPCHGSGFYKDGINFEGPAPRPLERFAIRLADDGQLEVDKSRKFLEEKGQWKDPASFVPV